MKKKPLVSIILPVFNGRELIGKALEAIFNQTYQSLEVIVIDDGSTDGTKEELEKFKEKENLKIIYQENQGAPRAKNNGAAMAKGDFLLFVGADDILYPQCVEKMVEALEKTPQASYGYCDYKMKGWREGVQKACPFDATLLRKTNYISCTSLILREHFPGWDPRIKGLDDWDLWLTLLDQGHTGVYIPEVLFEAIQRDDSITGSWTRNHWAEAVSEVLAKHQKIAIFTLTKNRLERLEQMFASLDKHTYIPYTHFIVDQGSTDGTREYLKREMEKKSHLKVIFDEDSKDVFTSYNKALDAIGKEFDYIVKLDDSCEILTNDWLYKLTKLILYSNNVLVLSPYVEGFLKYESEDRCYFTCKILNHQIGLVNQLSSISVISAATAYTNFRFGEKDVLNRVQDVSFSNHVTSQGYFMGYVEDIKVKYMGNTEK